jgi:hypothetical protein
MCCLGNLRTRHSERA